MEKNNKISKLFRETVATLNSLSQAPGAYYSPKGEKFGPGKVQLGETTIVGDPEAQPDSSDGGEESGNEIVEVAGKFKLPWEPLVYYNPTKDKLPEILNVLQPKGFEYINGVGLVPPAEIQMVKARLAQGWKYAGPGYGLIPQNWFNWLKSNNYI